MKSLLFKRIVKICYCTASSSSSSPPSSCAASTDFSDSLTPSIPIIIFTNPSAWAGYDTRSIFKRSLTGLNSEFSFS